MIKKGDLILLYKDPARTYLIKAKEDSFHTDKGFIKLADLIGKDYGQEIKTNMGERFYALRPDLYDLTMKVNRKTQIIYPKEIGTILIRSGIFPGARVLECGCGSGALTTALAHFIGDAGKVYSYEKNHEFLENTKKNIEKVGLSHRVEFKLREVIDSFDEEDIDFTMIDIGSPWTLIDAAYKALKPGARLAAICPTFEQITQTVFTLEDKKFVNIETVEILVRRILVRRGKTRPEQRMPSHTGYLVFATKTI